MLAVASQKASAKLKVTFGKPSYCPIGCSRLIPTLRDGLLIWAETCFGSSNSADNPEVQRERRCFQRRSLRYVGTISRYGAGGGFTSLKNAVGEIGPLG